MPPEKTPRILSARCVKPSRGLKQTIVHYLAIARHRDAQWDSQWDAQWDAPWDEAPGMTFKDRLFVGGIVVSTVVGLALMAVEALGGR